MHRRSSVLWIPLLAALFAGPLVERPPAAWPGEATPLAVDSPSSAVGYALPIARSLAALKARPPIDRHGPFWMAPADPPPGLFNHSLLFLEPKRHTAQGQGSSRHFPLFPTGPPSHS